MEDNKRKILFVYSHTGGGHIVSAKAIEQALHDRFPGCECEYFDFVAESSRFLSIFEYGYTPMIKYTPFVWHFLYKLLMPGFSVMLLEKSASPLMSKKILKRIVDYNPTMIVSVHPLANHLIARALRKSGNNASFVIVVTDPITFHRSWVGCDRFIHVADKTSAAIVATEEGHALAVKYGFPKNKLHKIGLPVRRDFL